MKSKRINLALLPGWGFYPSVFDIMLPHLSVYNTHLVELPALKKPDATEFDILAKSIPSPAVVAGWSLGGLVAIELCSRYPQQFSSLILLGSAPKFVADDNWIGIDAQHAYAFLNQANANMNKLIHVFQKLVGAPSHSIRQYLKTHACNNDNLIHQLHYLLRTDLREKYFNLHQPILSLTGAYDAVLPPSSSRSEVINDAGHAFPFTHHESVCKRMIAFMEQCL